MSKPANFQDELTNCLHYICDDDNYGTAFGFRKQGDKISMHTLPLHHATAEEALGAQPGFDAFLVVGGNHHNDSWKYLAVVATQEMWFVHDDPRYVASPAPDTSTFRAWADVIERLRSEDTRSEQPGHRRVANWVDSPTSPPTSAQVRRKMNM